MKNNRWAWFFAVIFLLCACVPALAQIERADVEAAWDRVTEADGFDRVPIEYEEEGGPNAWVAFEDGGRYSVHVTQEMMNALDSEEEMAGILGHEVGHVRLGHYNREVLSDIGQSLLEAHKDRMSGLAGAIGSIGVDLTKSQFSREQETEADEFGVELLVDAGYSPWGLYNAMKHFGTENDKTGGFATHPGTGPRLEHLAELARAEEDGEVEEKGPRQAARAAGAERAVSVPDGDATSDDVASDDLSGDGTQHRPVMGYSPPPVNIAYLADNPPKNITKRALSTNIPAKYDMRNTGRLTPVKDQGDYGTCWAHATMAACESNYLTRVKKGNYSGSLGNAQDLNLSEMFLAWFAFKDPNKAHNFSARDQNGHASSNLSNKDILDQGGNEWKSAAVLGRLGLVPESEMPYARFPSAGKKPGAYKRVLRLKDATFAVLEQNSAEQNRIIKQLIMDKGAVLFSYDEDGPYHDNKHNSYFKKGTQSTNHMITVVGWDDGYPRQNFGKNKPSRDGAWLVRNSWGPRWAAGGYFWMSYEQYKRSGTAFTVEPVKERMRHYGHDNLGWVDNIWLDSNNKKTGWAAGVFQIQEAGESVSEVGFWTVDNGVKYAVKVYRYGDKKPSGDTLTSGAKPVAEKSGTMDLAGYHTVKLPEPVPLKQGEWFSVVVKVTDPKCEYPIAIEQRTKDYSDNVVVNAGNSYFSADGKNWTDGVKLNVGASNATVKAFTLCGKGEPDKPDKDDDDDDDDDEDDDDGDWDEDDFDDDYDDDYDDDEDEDEDDDDEKDEDKDEDEDEDKDEDEDDDVKKEDEDEEKDEDEEDDSGKDKPKPEKPEPEPDKPEPKPDKPILPDGFNEEDYDVGIILIPKRK